MSIIHKTRIMRRPMQLPLNENTLPACPNFGVATETDMTFVHPDLGLIQDVLLEYFTNPLTVSSLCTSSVKVLTKDYSQWRM